MSRPILNDRNGLNDFELQRTKVHFMKGKEMHNHVEGKIFEVYWVYPDGIEKKIKDNVTYIVRFKYESWDYCGGLTGDSEGERYTPVYIEKAPERVLKTLEELRKCNEQVDIIKAHINELTIKSHK